MLKRGEEYQLCIGYKETETASVKEYFKTPWQTFSELPLQINGLTLDEVCDNFIRQINTRLASAEDMSLKEAIEMCIFSTHDFRFSAHNNTRDATGRKEAASPRDGRGESFGVSMI